MISDERDARLQYAWHLVLLDTCSTRGSIAALVSVLERSRALDGHDDRLLAQTADEIPVHVDAAPTGRRAVTLSWLEDAIGDGAVRVLDLRTAAADAGVSWRLCEAMKAEAGAVAIRRAGAWWWTLPKAKTARPQALAESPVRVST